MPRGPLRVQQRRTQGPGQGDESTLSGTGIPPEDFATVTITDLQVTSAGVVTGTNVAAGWQPG